MGNVNSSNLDRLFTRYDGVSSTHDALMIYVVRQFIQPHILKRVIEKWQKTISSVWLKALTNYLTGRKDSNLRNMCLELRTGSSAEGLSVPELRRLKPDGLMHIEYADDDNLLVDNSVFVQLSKEKAIQNKEHYYLDTSETYPGFARIRVVDHERIQLQELLTRRTEEKDVYYLSKYMIHMLKGTNPAGMSGPAITNDFDFNVPTELVDYNIKKDFSGEGSQDLVYAVNVSGMPHMVRKWHSQNVSEFFSQMHQSFVPVFLVGAAHKFSKDPDIEWRISFSFPELLIAKSFSAVQRQVYMTFKFLVKETMSGCKGIMTYHLKTTMLWVNENLPKAFWREDNLAQCLYVLLDKFIDYVAQGHLPNYFIPESNLLAHLSTDHMKTVLTAMVTLRQDPLGHLIKYQKSARLIGNCLFLDNSFESVLLPILQLASSQLAVYQDNPVVRRHNLQRLLHLSFILLAGKSLAENLYADVYQMVITHIALPDCLKCDDASLAYHEKVYIHLMHICRFHAQDTLDTDNCLQLVDYVRRYMQVRHELTRELQQRLYLLETFWYSVNAWHDGDEACLLWDQCAVAFASLELNDIVTVTEYGCFLYHLCQKRNLNTRSKFHTVSSLMVKLCTFLHNHLTSNKLACHGAWRQLNFHVDKLEPNLTALLQIFFRETVDVPHEILALFVLILTTAKLNDSLLSATRKLRQECRAAQFSGKENCVAGLCTHAGLIKEYTDFLHLSILLVAGMEKLLETAHALFQLQLEDNSAMVPGESRKTADITATFLLTLVKMYMGKWLDAFQLLRGVTSELLKFYSNCCLAVWWFLQYQQQTKFKQLLPRSTFYTSAGQQQLQLLHHSKICLVDDNRDDLYDTTADPALWGKQFDESMNINLSVNGMDMHFTRNRVVVTHEGATTAFDVDWSCDNIEHLLNKHLNGFDIEIPKEKFEDVKLMMHEIFDKNKLLTLPSESLD